MRNLLRDAGGRKTVLLGISLVIGALLAAVYLYFNVFVFERAPREQAERSNQTELIVNAGQITEQNIPLVNGLVTRENNGTAPISHTELNLPITSSSDVKNSKRNSAGIKLPRTKESRP